MSNLLEKSGELADGVQLSSREWKMFYRFQMILYYYPKPQSQHLSEDEKTAIKSLREHHKYSIDDLAFIFMRSKSTIHECLKKQGVSE